MINFIKNLFKNRNKPVVLFSKKCIKSLYRSTYKGYAFTKNKTYYCIEEDNDFFYMLDNRGDKGFNFSKTPKLGFYNMDEYFK